MKHWYRRLSSKIFLFILCILTFCIFAASVLGAVAMVEGDIYLNTEQYAVQNEWYGRMYKDANDILYKTLNDSGSLMLYDTTVTNLRYAVLSENGEVLQTNLSSLESVKKWEHTFAYDVHTDSYGRYIIDVLVPELVQGERYTVCIYLDEALSVQDGYALDKNVAELVYSLRYAVYPIGALAAVICLVCFITLMCASGRRVGSDALHPGYFYKIPADLMVITVGGALLLAAIFVTEVFLYTAEWVMVLLMIAVALLSLCALLGICMSIACRIKGKTLVQNTVFAMACKMVRKAMIWLRDRVRYLASALPLIPKTVTVLILSLLLDLILLTAAYDGAELAVALWIAKTLVLCLAVLHASISMRKLQKAGRALAKGEFSYRVDTEKMKGDFRRHGEDLNNISKGMALAVEERIKSERMKAELVTNVSHDIKTPLTSIINYAALVARQPCDNEKHGEYAEVLVRRSEHLKRLLEDLVEISKANTGNLEVDLQPMDAGVLLSQTAGEFAERCEAAGLFLVTSVTDEKMEIMADGRRLWRVFENLMNNALKYSLTGSRVYLSLHRENEEAVFAIRNTSKQALNISPEELTERFVRGDASRTTEGSGLGLSIAKSLTELQNGSMDIVIDGDLFKVVLRFKVL